MTNPYIYLICPVNDVRPGEKIFLDNYVSEIESRDCRVHYPPRDVNQTDPVGHRILREHRSAMREVDAVHAYLTATTKGSYFDFGMAYMGRKPMYIVNAEGLANAQLDDFAKFSLSLSENMDFPDSNMMKNLKEWAEKRRLEIEKAEAIEYKLDEAGGLNKQFFFDFGMAFYTGKPILAADRSEVQKLVVPGKKSFQNVLLELDGISRAINFGSCGLCRRH